jgi:SAM-dependent methyltransferase
MIDCPLCEHKTDRILYRIDAGYSAFHMFHYTGNREDEERLTRIIEELWGKDTASFLQCDHCGLAFSDPFLAGSSAFYSAIYKQDIFYPAWKWDYEITFQDLHQFDGGSVNLDDRLLEIGAGNGAFVKRLTESLFKKENIVCTEYSEFGLKEIRASGIECIPDFRALNIPANQGRFGVICMFQVLEHMENLEELFRTINSISRPGAILYITVPADTYRALYDRLGTHMDTPPNHISRWNHRSFIRLGNKYGWQIEQHAIQPMQYQEKLKKFIFNRLEHHNLFRKNISGKELASSLQKVGMILASGIMSLLYLRSMVSLKDKELGISQWIKMKKAS